jgi:hypothetical protein
MVDLIRRVFLFQAVATFTCEEMTKPSVVDLVGLFFEPLTDVGTVSGVKT